MGRLSDKVRSARRLGKSQRARVKKKHRCQAAMWGVPGAGTVEVKAGRKKFRRLLSFWRRVEAAHHVGEPIILNPRHCIKRPGYKMWWSSALLFLFLLTGCATWTPTDKALLTASWLAAGADAYYTTRAMDNGAHELNPALSSHPGDGRVYLTVFVSQVAVTALAHWFPRWRKWLLGGATVVHTGCAINNAGED